MLDLRKERGADAVALITLEWLKHEIETGETRIIIDGIRSMAEVRTMREIHPQLIVIGIHADPKTRYLRARGRNRQDDASSQESFDRRDKIELSVGIGDVIALSDIMISSQGDIDEIKAIYTDLLEDLISKTEIGLTTDV
jgi:dephospho-CoA kinase